MSAALGAADLAACQATGLARGTRTARPPPRRAWRWLLASAGLGLFLGAPGVGPALGAPESRRGAAVASPVDTGAWADGQVRIGDFYIDRYEYPDRRGQMPLSGVSHEEASRLCAERGARLCTEEEWELACRGPEGYPYGYGPVFEAGRCNTPYPAGDGGWRRDHGTAVSGAFGACSNGYGVWDMIGNLWEWTDGWYDAQQGWRVVRGGSWFNSANLARADGRYGRHLTSEHRLDLIGFRCCRSASSDPPGAP